MSYDNPNRQVYLFAAKDFSGAAATYTVRGPKGKSGRLIDYGVQNVSVDFGGATQAPAVKVGKTGTADAYGAALNLITAGATAANGGATVLSYAGVVEDEPGLPVQSTYLTAPELPADTPIILTTVQATGSGAAGTGQPFLVIDWVN